MKMPTFVGIFTFLSRENFMLSWVEHEKSFITSGPGFRLTLRPLLCFITVFIIICVSLWCFRNEVEKPYAYRKYDKSSTERKKAVTVIKIYKELLTFCAQVTKCEAVSELKVMFRASKTGLSIPQRCFLNSSLCVSDSICGVCFLIMSSSFLLLWCLGKVVLRAVVFPVYL